MTIHEQDTGQPPPETDHDARQTREARQQRYAAETEQHRRASLRDLEELFDRRLDGVADARRFREKLRWHACVFGDGTHGTGEALILAGLLRDERRLERARAGGG